MLDIKIIRKNPDLIRYDLKKRGDNESLKILEELIILDRKWRKALSKANKLRQKRGQINNEIIVLKKEEADITKKIRDVKKTSEEIKLIAEEVRNHRERMDCCLLRLPNILNESVPIGKDENDNVTVFEWGKIPVHDFPVKDHIALGLELKIIDLKRAAKTTGARFYYLKNEGVTIDFALMNFAINEMKKKEFVPIEPPFMMRRKPYEGVTAFRDFQEVLYKIENEDLYLIATSEHPIAAMYLNEVLNERDLPLKFVGVSPCFRKEAGAHGKDTKGIFRTHQFNKVEQFVFCKPEDSWKIHEELIENVKEIYERLELPFRVVNVCTGDIGTVAAKKYDLEVWMSAQQRFREVVSCSNCTDYQARRLNIRFRETEGRSPKGFVHTLNSTVIATGRTMVAILENFQEKDGSVIIPKVLRPFMNGIQRIG